MGFWRPNRRASSPSIRDRSIPITNGHLDLIQRGARLFDTADRCDSAQRDQAAAVLRRRAHGDAARSGAAVYPNVEVDSFDGLLVDYAAARDATVLLRGIRAISDYEYELQMALMNRRLRPEIETVFHDGERGVFLHQLAPGEGGVRAGREYLRAGAAIGGSQAAAAGWRRLNRREAQ